MCKVNELKVWLILMPCDVLDRKVFGSIHGLQFNHSFKYRKFYKLTMNERGLLPQVADKSSQLFP